MWLFSSKFFIIPCNRELIFCFISKASISGFFAFTTFQTLLGSQCANHNPAVSCCNQLAFLLLSCMLPWSHIISTISFPRVMLQFLLVEIISPCRVTKTTGRSGKKKREENMERSLKVVLNNTSMSDCWRNPKICENHSN